MSGEREAILTAAEVARRAGVSWEAVLYAIRRGRLKRLRANIISPGRGPVLIRESEAERWIKTRNEDIAKHINDPWREAFKWAKGK